MSELLLAIVSLVIGVAATLIVGRYYFRRTVAKSLTPYLHFSTPLFRGIAPEVRGALHIEYNDQPVEELMEAQFLIANTGERTIHDVIEPLTLALPDGCSLLDASLLHISPADRRITLTKTDREIRFEFPLLNRREFFLVRLLIQGKASPHEFVFTITADDLPPRLRTGFLPPDSVGTSQKQEFSWGGLIAAIVFGIFGAAFAVIIYDSWVSAPHPYQGFWSFVPQLSWRMIASAVAAIPTIFFTVISVIAFFAAFSGGSFPPTRRMFVLPRSLVRSQYPFLRHEARPIELPNEA
jgi:hypothetical protein